MADLTVKANAPHIELLVEVARLREPAPDPEALPEFANAEWEAIMLSTVSVGLTFVRSCLRPLLD
jgi:hypothetical protein